jgi:hypothetical protein
MTKRTHLNDNYASFVAKPIVSTSECTPEYVGDSLHIKSLTDAATLAYQNRTGREIVPQDIAGNERPIENKIEDNKPSLITDLTRLLTKNWEELKKKREDK